MPEHSNLAVALNDRGQWCLWKSFPESPEILEVSSNFAYLLMKGRRRAMMTNSICWSYRYVILEKVPLNFSMCLRRMKAHVHQ